MNILTIGKIYRYSRPYTRVPETIDGLPNYFHIVASAEYRLPLLDAGINPIASVRASDGNRCPAVLISSSPHKIGSIETPWQDTYDADNGFIRYFGDNQIPEKDPSRSPGNKVLLHQYEVHNSPDIEVRRSAVPILFFQRITYGGRAKGNLIFQGIGIILKAELITQYHQKKDAYFTNYVFEFAVLSLTAEGEKFNWDWITARRNLNLTEVESLKLAPKSWQLWIKQGKASVEKLRRRVSKLSIWKKLEQQPVTGSKEQKTLISIYEYYQTRKARFEALASAVAANIISRGGASYVPGWITPPSSDHGADFIARIDIGGSGLAKVKIVVLGQAKCESLNTPTSGQHIARTVARLKRGWIGVYVTTSYFSEPVQEEIIEDQYPILLINGLELAQTVNLFVHEGGYKSVEEFLDIINKSYDVSITNRRPEEILFD